MSNVQDEQYLIAWDEENHPEVRMEDLQQRLGAPPDGFNWQDLFEGAEPCRWDGLEKAMKQASAHFPGVLFSVTITRYDSREQFIQYHRDGRHYEAPEVRTLPEFDGSLMK